MTPMARKFSGDDDVLLNLAAGVLAFACVVFAGQMIRLRYDADQARLMASAGPPVLLSREAAVLASPDVTGAIDRAPRPGLTLKPAHDPDAMTLSLLTVVDGVAYIDVLRARGDEIWPVGEGGILPGAGRVLRISQHQGRWRVETARMTIDRAAQ